MECGVGAKHCPDSKAKQNLPKVSCAILVYEFFCFGSLELIAYFVYKTRFIVCVPCNDKSPKRQLLFASWLRLFVGNMEFFGEIWDRNYMKKIRRAQSLMSLSLSTDSLNFSQYNCNQSSKKYEK